MDIQALHAISSNLLQCSESVRALADSLSQPHQLSRRARRTPFAAACASRQNFPPFDLVFAPSDAREEEEEEGSDGDESNAMESDAARGAAASCDVSIDIRALLRGECFDVRESWAAESNENRGAARANGVAFAPAPLGANMGAVPWSGCHTSPLVRSKTMKAFFSDPEATAVLRTPATVTVAAHRRSAAAANALVEAGVAARDASIGGGGGRQVMFAIDQPLWSGSGGATLAPTPMLGPRCSAEAVTPHSAFARAPREMATPGLSPIGGFGGLLAAAAAVAVAAHGAAQSLPVAGASCNSPRSDSDSSSRLERSLFGSMDESDDASGVEDAPGYGAARAALEGKGEGGEREGDASAGAADALGASIFSSTLEELSLLGTSMRQNEEVSCLRLLSPLATPMMPPPRRRRCTAYAADAAAAAPFASDFAPGFVGVKFDADEGAFAALPLQRSFDASAVKAAASFAALNASASSTGSGSATDRSVPSDASASSSLHRRVTRIATPMPKSAHLRGRAGGRAAAVARARAQTAPPSRSWYWRRRLGVERWKPYPTSSSSPSHMAGGSGGANFARTWPMRH